VKYENNFRQKRKKAVIDINKATQEELIKYMD
jgi:DNA uptake protein ComE-like DNA-binding protein